MKARVAVVLYVLICLAGFIFIVRNPASSLLEMEKIPQAVSVSTESVGMEGVWEVTGADPFPARLVVQDVRENRATILLAWGEQPDGQFTGGWIRTMARLLPGGSLFWRQLGGLRFHLSPDHTTLRVTREAGNGEVIASLRSAPPNTSLRSLVADDRRQRVAASILRWALTPL